jgi:hypothetical protein
MAGSILVASLGIIAAVLCFLFWKLSEENSGEKRFPLQVIIFGFLLGVIVLLGKASVDYEDNCSWLVDNSTTVGDTTTYGYSYQCSENTNTTATTFYSVTLWIMRVTTLYLFFSFAFELFQWFAWRKKGGGQ